MKSDKNQKKDSQVGKDVKTDQDLQEKKIIELTALLKRVQAEFENYKKRIDRDKEDFVRSASRDIIMKLLPVLDNFELAIEKSDKGSEIVRGFELIFMQLFEVLEKEGLTHIPERDKFDPFIHEALMQEESDKEDNLILEVFQKGYMLGDKVLRPGKVKVNKQKINDKKDAASCPDCSDVKP